MSPSSDRHTLLMRMEEARRQTQHQLDLIDRQIVRRMTGVVLSLGKRPNGYRRGRRPSPETFLARYRAHLAAITAERQPEIDALSRKLARQEAAIAALRMRSQAHHPVEERTAA